VLTFSCARAHLVSRPLALVGAAVALSVMTWTPAQAQNVSIDNCVGGWRSSTCVTRWGFVDDPFVRHVPQPAEAEDRARAVEREHRWVNRCKPVVAQDRYGVARYRYAAPGCEFGVIEY